MVAETIAEFGMDDGSLCLEITERAVVDDIENTARTLTKLKDLGVQSSIDDFGTGYAVLSHLKTLPVDTLKIDPRFVRDLGTNRQRSGDRPRDHRPRRSVRSRAGRRRRRNPCRRNDIDAPRLPPGAGLPVFDAPLRATPWRRCCLRGRMPMPFFTDSTIRLGAAI